MTRPCATFAIACLSIVACDTPETCEIPPSSISADAAPRGLSLNRMSFNGIDLQGVWVNGAQWNGIEVQGMTLNSILWNSILWNGIDFQGSSLDGIDGAAPTVTLEAGRLVARDDEGNAIEGVPWTGAEFSALLSDGSVLPLVIESVTQSSPHTPMSLEITAGGTNICGDGGRGLFVPGVWDETGAHRDAVPGAPDFAVSFSCDTGVIAKCVRWGYAPWDVGEALHQTCTRLARADYCGDGVSFTKDGTRIDVYDAEGIVLPASDPQMTFEAGWGRDGAQCVSRPRYDESVVGVGETLPPCWADKPSCATAEEALKYDALMFNASEPTERLLCSPRE